MPVTGDRVRTTARLDAYLRPQDPGRNPDRGNLRHGDAFLVAAEKARLHPAHVQRVHHDTSREKQVPFRPAAGAKSLSVGNRVGHKKGRSVVGVISSSRRMRDPSTDLSWLSANVPPLYTHSSTPFPQIQM